MLPGGPSACGTLAAGAGGAAGCAGARGVGAATAWAADCRTPGVRLARAGAEGTVRSCPPHASHTIEATAAIAATVTPPETRPWRMRS